MRKSNLLNLHSWIGSLILWSYMFSLYIYKIWYITTAFVAYISLVFVINKFLRIKGLIFETSILLLYFLYLLMTAIWSLYPAETIQGVAIDSIYIVVFVVSYLSVLNVSIQKIPDPFIALPFIGLISSLALYDSSNDRIGEYVYFILPASIPFLYIAIVSLKKTYLFLAIPGLLITFGLSFVSMSRTSLAATIISTIISILVFSRSKLNFAAQLVSLFLISVTLIAVLSIIPITKDALNYSAERIQATYDEYNSLSDFINSSSGGDDHIRDELTLHVIELIPDYALSGMGYRTYKKYSEIQFGRAISLHSIYHIWIVEGGIMLVIIAISMLARYYYRIIKFISSVEDNSLKSIGKAYLISMSITLAIGLFHQTIQAPIFFVLLGGGIALTHKIVYKKLPRYALITN